LASKKFSLAGGDRGFESVFLQRRVINELLRRQDGGDYEALSARIEPSTDAERGYGPKTSSAIHEHRDLRVREHFDRLAPEDNCRDTATPV
jgi:hypothetical protein